MVDKRLGEVLSKSEVVFRLRLVQNGAVFEILTDADSNDVVYQQHSENEDAEVEMFADFLRTIDDLFGPQSSRYSRKRIHIVVKPGDKYEEVQENE